MSENGKDDRDLEAFLARGTTLQGRWREASGDEPSPELDAAVHAAARRAVAAGPRTHSSFAARWRVPLSIAAVVVVSATVSLMVADERKHLPATDLQAPAPLPAPHAAPAPVAPEAQEARRAAPAVQPPAGAAKLDSARQDDAPVPQQRMNEAPAAASAGSRVQEQAPVSSAQPEETVPRAAVKDEAVTPGRPEEYSVIQPAPAAAPPAGGAMTRERPAARSVQGAAAPSAAQPQSAAESEEGLAAKRAPVADALEKSREELDAQPERWIERIRALRAAGKRQEADESLREFVRRYPAYPLPPDLAGR